MAVAAFAANTGDQFATVGDSNAKLQCFVALSDGGNQVAWLFTENGIANQAKVLPIISVKSVSSNTGIATVENNGTYNNAAGRLEFIIAFLTTGDVQFTTTLTRTDDNQLFATSTTPVIHVLAKPTAGAFTVFNYVNT